MSMDGWGMGRASVNGALECGGGVPDIGGGVLRLGVYVSKERVPSSSG